MRLTGKILGLVLFLAGMVSGRAQVTFYWDTNGATAGMGTSGGTWDLATANWTTSGLGDSATVAWTNDGSVRAAFPISTDPASPAYLAGGSYTVDVAAALQVRGLDLGSVAWGPGSTLTFNGAGGITLSDPAIKINSVTTVFNVPFVSTVGLELNAGMVFPGTLVLNTANPGLQGLTTIHAGTLVYNHPGALGPETVGNGIDIKNGTLRFDYVSGGDFSYTLADPITVTGAGSGPHFSIAFLTYGSRSVTLTGPIVLDQGVYFAGGPVDDYGTAQINSTGVISETVANTGVLITGDVGLAGTNTFTGTIQVGDNYSDHGRLTVPVFNNNGVAGPLGAGSGLVLGHDDGEGGAGGAVIYTGATASSDRTILIDGDLGMIGVSSPTSTLTLTGVIAGSGGTTTHDLEKTGPGILVLRGANTFGGESYLTDGTLVAGDNNALGTDYVEVGYGNTHYASQLSLLLENNVTLGIPVDIGNNNNDGGTTTLGLSGSGNASFANEVYIERDVDVTVGAGSTLSFTDLFSDGNGGGWINKTGTGKAVFTGGIHLRGGGIDVAEGEVALSGSVILSEVIQVSSGAKLSGTALVSNATTGTTGLLIHTGATLAPGLVTGTMTTPMIFLENGSTLAWKLGSLTTANLTLFSNVAVDTGMVGGGSLAIDSTAIVAIDLSLLGLSQRPDYATLDPFWQTSQVWTLVDFSGPGANSLTPGALNPLLVTNGVWTGGTFDTFVGGGAGPFAGFGVGDVFLRFTPVPEPSTWALLGLGTAAALLPRLRRRR